MSRSPAVDDANIFAVLSATLFACDPVGIQNALEFAFSAEDIANEYDLEAAVLLRCRDQWPDAPHLGHAIKEVRDHYFAKKYPRADGLFLAELAMPAIDNRRVPLDVTAINACMAHRRRPYIPLSIP